MSEADKSAMVLTEGEWDDLAYIGECFCLNFDRPPFNKFDDVKRRCVLVRRIQEAVR